MTRYEKFIESINAPEELIQHAHKQIFLDEVFYGFCKGNCSDGDEYVEEHCNECLLRYLNEEVRN